MEAEQELQVVKLLAGAGLAETMASSMQHVLGQSMDAQLVQGMVSACWLHFQQVLATSMAGLPPGPGQPWGQPPAAAPARAKEAPPLQQQPSAVAVQAAADQGHNDAMAAALAITAAQAQAAQAHAEAQAAAATQATRLAAEAAQEHAKAVGAVQAAVQQKQQH